MVYLDREAINQLIEALNRYDFEPVAKLLADNVVLHCPGKNRLSGDYIGKSSVLDFWENQFQLTNGNFKPVVVSVVQGEGSLILIMEISTAYQNQVKTWRRVNHYRIVDGQVIEGWIYEGDQYTADLVFS
ncbi:MAG: nuclear transport factor 2 family protein [Chloroflexota bacterium]|nr:MAG: nuclear transport factor 2 family protein [Chloroflexota bacterium]